MKYFQCPYCGTYEGRQGKNAPKSIGKYRVKIIESTNTLIFKCMKCTKVFRITMRGSPLLWSDMTSQEKEAFKHETWRAKKKQGKKENGNKI